jgi:hypothetical protein
MALSANLLKFLTDVQKAQAVEPYYLFANPKRIDVRTLEKDGFVESNPQIINPADDKAIAYRLTAKGEAEIGMKPGFSALWGNDPAASPPAASPPAASPPAAEADTTSTPAKPRRGSRGPRGPNKPVAVQYSGSFMTLPAEVLADARRKPREEKLPFGSLKAPLSPSQCDSFFIPASEADPTPHKSKGGHVNKANKKYAADGRKFIIRALTADPEFGVAGARVFRVK